MEKIWMITMIGFLVGMIGTGLGGSIALLLKRPTPRCISLILGICSGMMLSIVCFDLLPEAFLIGNDAIGIVGALVGIMIMFILKKKMPTNQDGFLKMGILLGIGVALHNFPEGLAIGSGFMAKKSLGIGIAMVIGLHNLPEGMAMAAPLCIGGMNKIKVFLYTAFAGIPIGIGAFIGSYVGRISDLFIAFCLSFAGGTMLYITCEELIPSGYKMNNKLLFTVGLILGWIIGMFITQI